VRLAVTVFDHGVCRWVLRLLQEILHQVDGIVEVPRIHRADVEMDLARELGA
jgi:hypothetical protein